MFFTTQKLKTSDISATFFKVVMINFLFLSPFLLMFLNIISQINFGYAKQTEAVNIVFWCLSALSGFLLLRSVPKKGLIEASSAPLCFASLLMATISAITSIFHGSSILSWLGAVQMGEGVLMFLAYYIYALFFTLFLKDYTFLLKWILLIGIVFCLLTIFGINESLLLWGHYFGIHFTPHSQLAAWWAPYWFPDFLAFLILPLGALYWLIYGKKFAWLSWQNILAVFIFCLFAVFSKNYVLTYGPLIGLAGVIALYYLKKLFPNQPWTQWSVFGGAILTTLIIYTGDLFSFFPENILSRTLLLKATTAHLFEGAQFKQWWEALIGRGWGTYNNFLVENVYLLNVGSYKGTQLAHTWESLIRDQFHSHNTLFEYWIGSGLLGLVGLGFAAWKIVSDLKEETYFAGMFFIFSLIILSCFWFQNTAMVPYNILVLILLSKNKPLSSPIIQKLANWGVKAIPLFSVLLIGFGVTQGIVGQHILKNHQVKTIENAVQEMHTYFQSPLSRAEKYQDFYRTNNFTLAHMALTEKALKVKDARTQLIFGVNKEIGQFFLKEVGTMKLPASRVAAVNLLGLNVLHPRFKKYANEEDLQLWQKAVQEALTYLPYRGDLATPLLSYLIGAGKNEQALALVHQIRKYHPQNPVALWFQGMILLQSDDTAQEGIAKAYQALESGINRLMPIDTNQADKIRELYHQFNH